MSKQSDPFSSLELWGGAECTINRVQDEYFEQLDRTGHSRRLEDLDRFAELGIKALRQPVLWERACPSVGDVPDWAWSDRSLAHVRELGMRPILGMVHHGSGPAGTDLLDPLFPEKLAAYASQVARRYPWVDAYTPVNEPLTTARFSCLYGHWYPHRRDDFSFITALLNECRGVVLSMRAVREIRPNATLVQTEDLGKTFATPQLQYQADFENERRWLTFDLLCGFVNSSHPLWSYLRHAGISATEIDWFAENPCPPDVLGFNYYLTSERFLDHRTDLYRPELVGGNGRDAYVDVEAARVRAEGVAGAGNLLLEAWERFGLPLAITECHNGCTREEQLRWIRYVWGGVLQARARGADVRAVTLWSLLGAFDWNTLVTRKNDWYEPGVFDVRGPHPRPTAIAAVGRQLASGHEPEHPLLQVPGWWERQERLQHGFSVANDGSRTTRVASPTRIASGKRPVLITGGTGTLGRAFERACISRAIPYKLLVRRELDIANAQAVRECLDLYRPWAVINAAGYVRVDQAEEDAVRCHRENRLGPVRLAAECQARGIRLATFSSDLVFDGLKRAPYLETDDVRPLNEYGSSKALAEAQVLGVCRSALIVRTSAFFGPWDEHNFVTIALRNIAAGREFRAADDVTVSPTYVPDLLNSTLDLLIDGAEGIWHLANAGSISWAALARLASGMKGYDQSLVTPCSITELGLRAQRPVYSVLGSERASVMPTLGDALNRYLFECAVPLHEKLAA